jgi:hypothetical protein
MISNNLQGMDTGHDVKFQIFRQANGCILMVV